MHINRVLSTFDGQLGGRGEVIVLCAIVSNVLGRGFPDDKSVYFAFVLNVVLQVRSNLLAVLVPFHLQTFLGQFALQAGIHVHLIQLDVLELFHESDFFDCINAGYQINPFHNQDDC